LLPTFQNSIIELTKGLPEKFKNPEDAKKSVIKLDDVMNKIKPLKIKELAFHNLTVPNKIYGKLVPIEKSIEKWVSDEYWIKIG
jgi:hypothetical protein